MLFMSLTLLAQDPFASVPMTTDRPGLLLAPTLVPPGRTQLETGLPQLVFDDEDGTRTRAWSVGATLRHGVSERVELRVTAPAWNWLEVEDATGARHVRGAGDPELGLKLALGDTRASPTALVATLRLPSGADEFALGGIGTSLALVHGRALGVNSVTGLLGVAHAPLDGGADASTALAGVLVARPLAERVTLSGELALQAGLRHAPGTAQAGAALCVAVRRDVQLDFAVDLGLEADAPDLLASVGFSWRF